MGTGGESVACAEGVVGWVWRLTCRSRSSSLCLAVEADPGRAVPEPWPGRVTPVSRSWQRLHHGAAGQCPGAVEPVHLLHCNPSVSRTQHSSRSGPNTLHSISFPQHLLQTELSPTFPRELHLFSFWFNPLKPKLS